MRPHGSEITLRQLMSSSSGLIDDDDIWATNATDEAAFLTALTNGTLLGPRALAELGAGDASGCGGPPTHGDPGVGNGFESVVVDAADGSRVAVLLLNGVTPGEAETGWARSTAAAADLYCAG